MGGRLGLGLYELREQSSHLSRTIFTAEARDELRKIPREMALRILSKLTELETDPLGFNTTAMVSRPERRRLRVVENDELTVWMTQVGHRSSVYDSLTPKALVLVRRRRASMR